MESHLILNFCFTYKSLPHCVSTVKNTIGIGRLLIFLLPVSIIANSTTRLLSPWVTTLSPSLIISLSTLCLGPFCVLPFLPFIMFEKLVSSFLVPTTKTSIYFLLFLLQLLQSPTFLPLYLSSSISTTKML